MAGELVTLVDAKPRIGASRKWPFDTLEVGGPALLYTKEEIEGRTGSLRSSANQWAKRQKNGAKFACFWISEGEHAGKFACQRVA